MSQPTNEFDTSEPPVAEIERRQTVREPVEEKPTYLWVSLADCVQARLKNQSQGGLAVLASREHQYEFEVDFQIRVQLEDGKYRMARVVHVSDYDEERLIVGVCWEDEWSDEAADSSA